MKRLIPVFVVLVVLAAACGGGDDAENTTAAPTQGVTSTVAAEDSASTAAPTTAATTQAAGTEAPTTTSAPETGPGGDDDFCRAIAGVDTSEFDFGLDPESFRSAMEQTMAALRDVQGRAPGEIRDDLATVIDGFAGFVELLEEVDYNFLALGSTAADDPRLLRFEEEDFVAAAERVSSYCGVDIDLGGEAEAPNLGGGPDDIPDLGTDVPEDFPAELVPPGSTSTVSMGNDAVLFSTSTSFDALVDYYEGVLGAAVTVQDGQMALWTAQYQGDQVGVTITTSGTGTDVLVALVP